MDVDGRQYLRRPGNSVSVYDAASEWAGLRHGQFDRRHPPVGRQRPDLDPGGAADQPGPQWLGDHVSAWPDPVHWWRPRLLVGAERSGPGYDRWLVGLAQCRADGRRSGIP